MPGGLRVSRVCFVSETARVKLKSGRVQVPADRVSILAAVLTMSPNRRYRGCFTPITPPTTDQGLTLLHFSAQRKRFVWDRGCIQWGLRGCVLGVRRYEGVSRGYFVSEMAQVELKSGRV